MRTGIPLKITSAYLYCYLFLQSLNNISLNCANIKYSMAINNSYFKEEYSIISICSLKYKFKKEEKSDPDIGHFFPGSVQLAWNLLAWFTNLKIWVLKTWKPRWFYWLAQTSFYDCILSQWSPKSMTNTDLSLSLPNVSKMIESKRKIM